MYTFKFWQTASDYHRGEAQTIGCSLSLEQIQNIDVSDFYSYEAFDTETGETLYHSEF